MQPSHGPAPAPAYPVDYSSMPLSGAGYPPDPGAHSGFTLSAAPHPHVSVVSPTAAAATVPAVAPAVAPGGAVLTDAPYTAVHADPLSGFPFAFQRLGSVMEDRESSSSASVAASAFASISASASASAPATGSSRSEALPSEAFVSGSAVASDEIPGAS